MSTETTRPFLCTECEDAPCETGSDMCRLCKDAWNAVRRDMMWRYVVRHD